MSKSMFTFTFGKFKDCDVEDVDTWYLEYIIGEEWFCEKYPKGVKAIKSELKYREQFGDSEKEIDTNWNRR